MIEQMFTIDQTPDPCWEFAKNIDSGLRGTNVKSFWRRDLAPRGHRGRCVNGYPLPIQSYPRG